MPVTVDINSELTDKVESGDIAAVKGLLSSGVDVNTKDSNGWTSLMIATVKGDTVIVNALLDEGASVNTKDYYGGTVLMSAAAGGHLHTVQVLVDRGADVNAKCCWPGVTMTAMMWAMKNGHFNIVRLLKFSGAEK